MKWLHPKVYCMTKGLPIALRWNYSEENCETVYKVQEYNMNLVKITFIMLTPDPMFTSKYGKILGSAFWNLYSGVPCRWYTNASSEMFFSRKLHPLMRQLISSSLSTLRKWSKQPCQQCIGVGITPFLCYVKVNPVILFPITLQSISIVLHFLFVCSSPLPKSLILFKNNTSTLNFSYP